MPTQIPPPAAVVGLVAAPDAPEARRILALAAAEFGRFGVRAENRTPATRDEAGAYAREASARGLRALLVGSPDAGLPAALAAMTPLPVVRVPVAELAAGNHGLALLWPEGEPCPAAANAFATVAIGEAGARNAALFVVSVLALNDAALRDRWREFRETQKRTVLAATLPGLT